MYGYQTIHGVPDSNYRKLPFKSSANAGRRSYKEFLLRRFQELWLAVANISPIRVLKTSVG